MNAILAKKIQLNIALQNLIMKRLDRKYFSSPATKTTSPAPIVNKGGEKNYVKYRMLSYINNKMLS